MHHPIPFATSRRRAVVVLFTALALALGLVAASTLPAEAATRTVVKIKTIPTKTAPYDGKATVKPKVRVRGNVRVLSKTLTVKRGTKVVAKNRPKVRLKPGKYRVKTRVKFQRWTEVDGVRKYSATKTKTKSQKLRVKRGARPNRTDPVSLWDCPSWAPIKGNASSMIYHLPGQRYYDATQPEDCFRTESAAQNAGYRKAKV